MPWWERIWSRRGPQGTDGDRREGSDQEPAVAAALEALQADVRRLGVGLVRVEAQVKGVVDRVGDLTADLRAAVERLQATGADAAAGSSRAAAERQRLLLPFLDLADNFGRALRVVQGALQDAGGETPAAAQVATDAVMRLADHLQRILADAGLEAVAAPGMPFDPRVHRAVGVVPDPEGQGQLVLVDRQGYRLDGVLLRPAEVWVAAPPRASAGETETSAVAPADPGPVA